MGFLGAELFGFDGCGNWRKGAEKLGRFALEGRVKRQLSLGSRSEITSVNLLAKEHFLSFKVFNV